MITPSYALYCKTGPYRVFVKNPKFLVPFIHNFYPSSHEILRVVSLFDVCFFYFSFIFRNNVINPHFT